MNTTEKVDEVKMSEIEQLKKEIEDLKRKREETQKRYKEKQKEIENSAEYTALSKREKEINAKQEELDKKIDKKEAQIKSKFLENVEKYTNPTYSATYGNNIKSIIIEAVKKTFDFKKLSGGAIEGIVQKMISDTVYKDQELKELRGEMFSLNYENDQLNKKQRELEEPSREIESESYQLSNKIEEKEDKIALLLISKKETSSKELKQVGELTNKYTKKRALESYRLQCENDFRKVFENLKDD